jgi:hypothetical protein
MLKTKTTKRKFYGKWLYKVTLSVPGIAILRSKTLTETIEFLESKEEEKIKNIFSIHQRARNNSKSIIKVCSFLKNLEETSWTKRIECNLVDFYTNDLELYTNLCNKFQSILIHNFEPEKGMVESLNDQYTILTKKYPHNLYRYKVFLKPHKLKNDPEAKTQFVNWMSDQQDSILISDTVKNWFIKTEWNWDRRYVLVTDANTLLMLKLRSCDAIGKVYEYKIVDK